MHSGLVGDKGGSAPNPFGDDFKIYSLSLLLKYRAAERSIHLISLRRELNSLASGIQNREGVP
jgi:hypothetical protein